MTKIWKSVCLILVVAMVLSLGATLLPAREARAQPAYAYETPVSATASSELAGWPASNAIDGNTADPSIWFSEAGTPPEWIYFDLGTEKWINAVNVYIYPSDVPMTMDIEVSDDASTWTTVVSGWTVSSGNVWVENSFTATRGRFIRLYQTAYPREFGTCTEFQARTGKIGDVNGDGNVNISDMVRVAQHWGQIGIPGWIAEDVKQDGVINVADMVLMAQNWTG